MTMTRRDYQMVADSLKESRHEAWAVSAVAGEEVEAAIRKLADTFERERPGFKRDKFLKACGM